MSADGAAKTADQGVHPFSDQFVYLGKAPLKARQIGLVPGAEVPLLPVDLPGGLRGHAREQVADRQMRDALAGGADLIEVRPFHEPGAERSWQRVLVADRARLSDWRAQAGAEGRAVLPDYLALPVAPEVWTITTSGGMVLARLGLQDGFSAPPSMARHMLEQALREADPAPRAIFTPDTISPELETVFVRQDIPVTTSHEALRALDLDLPKALSHGELAFDLRRDGRAARERLAGRVLPWRWPILVGLLAAALWTAAQLVALHTLEKQTENQRNATLETVRAQFVPSGPVLDIRTQVSRALAEARVAATGAGETVSPLDLLGLAAEVMAGANARPDYVDYTITDGLSASVRVENFAAAEDLATALRDAGLTVNVVESRVSDEEDGVRTDLRIGPATEKADP